MLGLYLDTVVIGHKCLQYVKYTKWINNAKAFAQFYVNNDFFWTKSKKKTNNNNNNNKTPLQILAKTGNRNRDLSHASRVCYLAATETTERVDWNQAFKLFQLNRFKRKQSMPNLRATLFQQGCIFVIF